MPGIRYPSDASLDLEMFIALDRAPTRGE